MSGKRYDIKTFDDIMNIPLDRLHDFFEEFEACIRTAKLVEKTGQTVSETFRLTAEEFYWIDDGDKRVYINLHQSQDHSEVTD